MLRENAPHNSNEFLCLFKKKMEEQLFTGCSIHKPVVTASWNIYFTFWSRTSLLGGNLATVDKMNLKKSFIYSEQSKCSGLLSHLKISPIKALPW